jgi:hypothetical protein
MDWRNLLSLKEIARRLQGTPLHSAPLVNRREFTRIPLSVEVDILSGAMPILSGLTKDVSMKGLYLLCDEHLPVGGNYRISLLLSGREPSALVAPLMLCIQVNGRIVRASDSGLGIEFVEIVGQDSFDHLYHLLLRQSEALSEAEQVKQELQHAVWTQSTTLLRPFEDGTAFSATRFSLKRDRRQADTEVELSPGCVILLDDSCPKRQV